MPGNLSAFLSEIPEHDFDKQTEFAQFIIPRFLTILGYDSSDIYYEVTSNPIEVSTGPFETSQQPQQADAIVAGSPHSRPWLVLETLYTPDRDPKEYDARYAIAQEFGGLHLEAFESEYYAEISDGHLFISSRDGDDFFVKLDNVSSQKIHQIKDMLTKPDELPQEPSTSVADYSDISIDKDLFKFDVGLAVSYFESVQNASNAQEKGDALEDLASFTFNGIPCLSVRGHKVRTRVGEIDLVVEYLGHSERTVFDEFDRFILVECKNWTKPVGSSEVRVMKSKMDDAQVDLGVLFARSGISGENGEDAVGVIDDAFTDAGKIIVVISEKDIQQVLRGQSFYQILDEKIYRRKFSI